MILVDANLLLYAKFVEFPQHERARGWLDRQLRGPAAVGLPWASLLAFVRIGSNPKLFTQPLDVSSGMRQVNRWLGEPGVWTPAATPRHSEVLTRLLATTPKASPKAVTDAHLAALAIQHGLVLCTADRGFGRFGDLRWENPIL